MQIRNALLGDDVGEVIAVNHDRLNVQVSVFHQLHGVKMLDKGGNGLELAGMSLVLDARGGVQDLDDETAAAVKLGADVSVMRADF